MDGCDVGMIQRREHLRLAPEARHALLIMGERLRQDFDSDVTAEHRVMRPIHLAHAARADGREDLVRSETSPRCQRHKMSNNHTPLDHSAADSAWETPFHSSMS